VAAASGATRPVLIPPGSEVGFLGDAAIPADLYFVAHQPVEIIGMGFPSRVDWQLLWERGVRHVVCLTHRDATPYDASPLTVHLHGLQDLFARPEGPDDPDRERALVHAAAGAVVDAVLAGEGVAVHCRGGRGRVGTVLGVALVRLGHAPADVVTWFDRLHRMRGKGGWPETPWQAEVVLRER
jgi:hypothetical protein